MFSKNASDTLYKELVDKGYNGSVEELFKSLNLAKTKTSVESIYQFIDRDNSIDEKVNSENISFVKTLLDKLLARYEDISANECFMRPSIRFNGKDHNENRRTFDVVFYFSDMTSHSTNGVIQAKEVRILFGYKDRMREKTFIFIDKKIDDRED
jgi:hypothetical protein